MERWFRILLLGIGLALPVACRAKNPDSAEPTLPLASQDAATSPLSVADARATDAAETVPEPAEARWTHAGKGQTAFDWIRSAGAHAPPLVLRGMVTPEGVLTDPGSLCDEIPLGSRLGITVNIKLEGKPRPLYLRALARGPMGVAMNATGESYVCATAGPNEPLRIDVASATGGSVGLRMGEVDHPGERSGQTFPYVVVVSDEPLDPKEQPDERPPLPPKAVTARWALVPMKCPDSECCTCWHAGLQLGGAVKKTIPLKGPLVGQSGCWPFREGIVCAGASGMGTVSVGVSPTGQGSASMYSESDGYCPEGEECGSTTALMTFTLPPGLQLVPDPLGTFPPPQPAP